MRPTATDGKFLQHVAPMTGSSSIAAAAAPAVDGVNGVVVADDGVGCAAAFAAEDYPSRNLCGAGQ